MIPHRSGQIVPFLAITLVVLLVFVALTVDAGLAYTRHRQEQTTADLAAAAGSHVLAINDGSATDSDVARAIATVAVQNGGTVDFTNNPPDYVNVYATPVGVVGTGGAIPSEATGIRLSVAAAQQAFFAPIIQFLTFYPGASSDDICYPADSPAYVEGLSPLSLPIQDFQAGQYYDLWNSQYAKDYGVPSNFKGALNLNQGTGSYYQAGASCGSINTCLTNWTANGFDGRVGVTDNIQIATGNHGSNVASALNQMIATQNLSDSGGSYAIIYVSVWDAYNSAASTIHVMAFAAFKIYQRDVTASSLRGHFISLVSGDFPKTGGLGVSWGPKSCKFVNPYNVPTVVPTATKVPTP